MYLDPGFGGMLVQVLIAIVAAGGILMFSLRRKIKALFSKNKKDDKNADDIDTSADGVSTSAAVNDEDGVIDMLSDDKTNE